MIYIILQREYDGCIGLVDTFHPEAYTNKERADQRLSELDAALPLYSGFGYEMSEVELIEEGPL